MPETLSKETLSRLPEIRKWQDMGFTQGQIAKKTGLRPPQISLAFAYIKKFTTW